MTKQNESSHWHGIHNHNPDGGGGGGGGGGGSGGSGGVLVLPSLPGGDIVAEAKSTDLGSRRNLL